MVGHSLNRLIFFGLFLGIFSSCSHQPALSKKQSVGSLKGVVYSEVNSLTDAFQVHRFRFKNGLKLLLVEDHTSPTFAYQTWYNVGSRNETPGKTGLAHLFEHMMFKQTTHLKEGEFDRLLEKAGTEGENAFTSQDYTAYVQELPKAHLELIARLESDRMINLVINQNAFKTEREVVQNERRFRLENNPAGLMHQALYELAFTQHSYRWPIIGYEKDLSAMTDKDARDFYKRFYSPNNATIIIAGDIDPTEAVKTVQKYYGSIPSQSPQIQKLLTDSPIKTPRKKAVRLNLQVEKLLLAYRIPAFSHSDFADIDFLETFLTAGRSSRLKKALVNSGVATNVEAFGENKDPSLFTIGVNLQKGKTAAQAEAIVLKEIEKLQSDPPTQAEMELARNHIKFRFFGSLGSNVQRAYYLGHYEITAGSFENALEHHQKMLEVTPDKLIRAARAYLNPNSRVVVYGVKK